MKQWLMRAALALVLVVCVAAWLRSAWAMPLRNFAFDFSINYTGARLISLFSPDRPLYDRATLAAEAAPYTIYPALYSKLFLTYIQTPITAVLTLPISRLPYENARLAFLALSNLLLVLAAVMMMWVLRPSWLLVLVTLIIFATYEAMFDSLRLGQVDAIIVCCLALAFVLLRRGPRPLLGAPLALAAILKLSPAILIGYFAWRREWRVVAVAAGSGVVLLGLSVLVAGWQNHVVFVRDVLPALMKGSTFYDNISISGAAAREHFGAWSWYHEDEVPAWPPALRLGMLALNALIVLAAYVRARNDPEAGFMLCIPVAVLVSPVAWSFYPTWLLPTFLWLVRRYEDRRAWWSLAAFAALYPLLAIVPAHLSALDPQIYRLPLKTLALALYTLLLFREAGVGIAAGQTGTVGAMAAPRGGPARAGSPR